MVTGMLDTRNNTIHVANIEVPNAYVALLYVEQGLGDLAPFCRIGKDHAS
jgi:hypothetical protein